MECSLQRVPTSCWSPLITQKLQAVRMEPLRGNSRRVYGVRVPNKVKHFAWRACNNALPTMSNLALRLISTTDLCEQCKATPEDTIHALWACKELEGVWGSLFGACSISLARPQSFNDLLDCFLQVQEDYRKELFIMVAWAVWNRRNSLKFGHPTVTVDCISSKASAMLQEFLAVQASPVLTPITATLHQWQPPKYPFFKANFNAAVFKSSSSAGINVIIRDGMGEAIGALTMPIPLANSVATMEALACHKAVLFAKEIGLLDMIFEGNSAEVI